MQPSPHAHVDEEKGILTLRNLSHLDNGTYRCHVLTEGQEPVLSETATLTIREKLKFFPKPDNTKLELDKSAKLTCIARGEEPPTVNWLKVGFFGYCCILFGFMVGIARIGRFILRHCMGFVVSKCVRSAPLTSEVSCHSGLCRGHILLIFMIPLQTALFSPIQIL